MSCIFIVGVKEEGLEETVRYIVHETLHHVLSSLPDRDESYRANYGLDYVIFERHEFDLELGELDNL